MSPVQVSWRLPYHSGCAPESLAGTMLVAEVRARAGGRLCEIRKIRYGLPLIGCEMRSWLKVTARPVSRLPIALLK
jgi:hypothetical protein